ncbi:MAG: hypothetical protein V3R65_05245 [Acidiferrobacterales bacterium]
MIRIALVIMLLIPAFTFADTLLFGNNKNGGKLHQRSCTACHDSKVYTRKDRKIRSINGLEGRVETCSINLNTHYTDGQNSDIVKFLNDNYYQFK